MISQTWLAPGDARQTDPGRPRLRIGVDLGGTKIEAIAIDAAGTTLARLRVPTPAADYDATLGAVAGLVTRIEQTIGGGGAVGVGTPGAISPKTGLIKNANSVVLNGRPLDRDLAQALGRPVRLENDANCFALSEATDGAGAGYASVFGVILGTGVGGGFILEGRIVGGANRIAGEWGHNPLPWPTAGEQPGAPCYCGRRGCVETVLSGAGLARTYEGLAGHAASGEEIAARAKAGEAAAIAALDRYREQLARALAGVVNVLDPHVIVLGGGLSNLEALYDGLTARVSHHAFSDGIETPVLRHRHGDSSGVRGAAWLAPQEV